MLAALLRENVALWLPDLPFPLPGLARPTFERKIKVDFTARDFRVKTVESLDELRQVLALRRSVFHYEFAKKWISLKSDKDAFDDFADHLAIFDERHGRVVGVYRLIASQLSRRFYSSTEFDLSHFLASPGHKLELSRACIAKDYRNGVVISLLWRGIAEYARAAGSDYLFGLSSVTSTDVAELAAIHRHFQDQGLEDLAHNFLPRAKYRIEGFEAALAAAQRDPSPRDAAPLVPPLVKTYIRAGARVCSHPVIDRAFNCADWLTVMDLRKLTAAYERKYMKD